MKRIVILIFTLLFSSNMYAKNYTIHGYIKDSQTHKPLAFTNISIAGTNRGTASNMEGEFTLKIDSSQCRLIVSYVGYKKKILTVNLESERDTTFVPIFLTSEPILMEEIVVKPGYNPAEELIKKIYKKVRQNNKNINYVRAFYRQYSAFDSVYIQVREIFYDLWVIKNGIKDWAINHGREAVIKDIFDRKKEYFTISNFSTFTRKYRVIQKDESFFNFLPFIGTNYVFLIPIREKPEKYFNCKIVGYRQQDEKKVTIIEVNPKKNVKKSLLCGTIEIFEDNLEILQSTLSGNHQKLNGILLGTPFPGIYIEGTQIKYHWVNRQWNENEWGTDFIEVNISYHVKSKESDNYDRYVTHNSIMLFYDYQKQDFSKIKKMTGKEDDTSIIKDLEYDPDFWEKNSTVIEEIPMPRQIIKCFIDNGFYGNVFPGGLVREQK